MTDQCCSRLVRGPSPFVILALGWYDGPISGLARCKVCDQAFHFEMLAWDDEQAVRVYAFARINSEQYLRIVALQEESSDDGVSKANQMTLATRDALAGSFGRTLYVVAQDLGAEILSSRELDFAGWQEIIEGR